MAEKSWLRSHVVAGLAVLALAAACAPAAGPPAAKPAGGQPAPAEKVVLRPDWLPTGNNAFAYVAREKGYFAAEGLEVEILHGRGSTEVVQVIGAGDGMFGYGDLGTMAKARSLGAPLKAVFGIIQANPMAVISLAETNIREPKDLVGKTFSGSPGSAVNVVFPAFLELQKIDPNSVTHVMVEPAARNTVVVEKRAHGTLAYFMDNAPLIEEACKCPVNVLKLADYGVTSLSSGIFARDDTLRQKPELVKRFLRAVSKGIADVAKDPQEAAQLQAKSHPQLNVEVQAKIAANFSKQTSTPNTQGKPLGWMSDEDWQATMDLFVQTGIVDKPVPLAELYTNEFVPMDLP
jgi:NitT/TauT family transport system substrate-binding protein